MRISFTTLLAILLGGGVGFVTTATAKPLLYFTLPQQDTVVSGIGKQISAVTWSGLRHTKPYIVERELIGLQAGDLLDSTSLFRCKERLESLDIFSKVVVSTEVIGDQVAIQWDVIELPPIVAFPAVGSDSRGNAQYGGGAFSLNLGGRDIEGVATVMLGNTKNYDVVIKAPWISGNHFSSEFTSSYGERENPLERFYEKTLAHSLWLGSWMGKTGRVGLGGGWFAIDADSVNRTVSNTGHDEQFWYGMKLGVDLRDRTTKTFSGWLFEMELRSYTGDGDFSEGMIDSRWWLPLKGKVYWYQSNWLRLRDAKPETGLPRYYLLRVGGSNTVRGYTATDQTTGSYGANEYIVTSELRWRILPEVEGHGLGMTIPFGMELVGFTDVGAAWTSSVTDTRRTIGGGFGLHFLVPSFQEVRFDFGIGEGGNRAFSFGLNTKMNWQVQRVR